MKHRMKWIRLGIVTVALTAACVMTAEATAYGTATVTSGPLRMRSGPDTSAGVISSANAGDSVIVLSAADNGWYRVSYDGAEGYMSSSYLSVTTPVPDTKNAAVQADALNLRAGAGTSYEVVGSANKGDKVTLLAGPTNGWYKVCLNGTVGYMSAEYLSGGSATQSLGTGTVNVSALNLRSSPGTDGSKLLVLGQGAVVELLELSNGWYKVSYNGTVGYVSADYITQGGAQSANAGVGSQAVTLAKKYLGVRYVYGGESPSGFDCSGFSQYIYKQVGYSINRTASTQLQNGASVSKANLQIGDLVFFRQKGSKALASHVGIYIGDGQFIHASSTGRKVMISDLSSGWYSSIFTGARRIA